MSMISAIGKKPNKPTLKVIRNSKELFVNEVPDVFFIGSNNKHQEIETRKKSEPEAEIGLPPQPKEYLKYPDYDWF